MRAGFGLGTGIRTLAAWASIRARVRAEAGSGDGPCEPGGSPGQATSDAIDNHSYLHYRVPIKSGCGGEATPGGGAASRWRPALAGIAAPAADWM